MKKTPAAKSKPAATPAAPPTPPGPPALLVISEVLMDIGRAQKKLHALALQELGNDQSDGIRWTSWLNRFSDIRRLIVEDAQRYSDIDEKDAEAINNTACG
jgi:hypothetical protein